MSDENIGNGLVKKNKDTFPLHWNHVFLQKNNILIYHQEGSSVQEKLYDSFISI